MDLMPFIERWAAEATLLNMVLAAGWWAERRDNRNAMRRIKDSFDTMAASLDDMAKALRQVTGVSGDD